MEKGTEIAVPEKLVNQPGFCPTRQSVATYVQGRLTPGILDAMPPSIFGITFHNFPFLFAKSKSVLDFICDASPLNLIIRSGRPKPVHLQKL